ncbi:MAG: glycoside hydrolase family 3 N-terminal domain-containing protein [Terriglobia bacterium]|jgi:beta-N-acetylhexosaminidase
MKSQSQSLPGHLLMLRLAELHWSSSFERRLGALAPGGILLAGPLPRAPETLWELLTRISQSLPSTPFLAIDDEGGGAAPLSALLPPLPSPRAVAAKGARAAGQVGELMGTALRLLGFNTNLGPELDLASAFAERTLGTCTFGADPYEVAQCGRAFVEGLKRHKILACGKHFPGLASVPPAASGELPISGRSMAELWRSDLVPYRELLPQLPLVMMSTAAYKAYDFDYPRSAVLSAHIVERLLRAKLGYRGVVVAPQLESQDVRGVLDLSSAAVQSVNAGCDLLVVEREESWLAMRQALESGKLPDQRLEQALGRIRAAKKGLAQPGGQPSRIAWKRLMRRFEEFNSRYEEQKSA